MGPTDRAATRLDARLAAARGGDERAFVELTAPQRAALHAHCYRLLGSVHDADDALQEALLRAWRGIDRFEPRAPIAPWLYRIATNVCLRMLEQRKRGGAVDAHLEPYPQQAVENLAAQVAGPEALAESREAVGLAFVAAMQLLTPKQRAVLVLRDVLDLSAREVAEMLDDSVAAVNSAVQRARAPRAGAQRPFARAGARTGRRPRRGDRDASLPGHSAASAFVHCESDRGARALLRLPQCDTVRASFSTREGSRDWSKRLIHRRICVP
jgi:RNA polymerase sigma-70 factor (TIGR02960 family)